MSNTELELMSPQEAGQFLEQNIYAPVFFEKLAQDYNIVPSTEDEAIQLAELGVKLKAAQQHTVRQKQASQGSFLQNLNYELDHYLHNLGVAANPTPQANDGHIKQAAQVCAENPEIANAVLSFQIAADAASE